jgi:hypothetical protein
MGKELALNTPAPEALLLNDQNQEVNLSSFWAKGPTLLTFLRHFG